MVPGRQDRNLWILLSASLADSLAACGIRAGQPWWIKLLHLLFVLPENRESRPWQDRLQDWFPHIDFRHLHPADALRIPLQCLWLLLARPRPPAHPAAMKKQPTVLKWAARSLQWLEGKLTSPAGPVHATLAGTLLERAATGLTPRNPAIWFLLPLSLGLAVTTPAGEAGQAVIALGTLATAMFCTRGRESILTLLLLSLSLLASSRYFWWRLNETLPRHDQADLTLGLLLLLAEAVIWVAMLLPRLRELQGKPRAESAPGFLTSLACNILTAFPAVVLLGNVVPIQAAPLALSLHLLPHLLLMPLALAGPRPLARSARQLALSWQTLFPPRGKAASIPPLGWLALLNLAALSTGFAAWNDAAGLQPLYLLWALANALVLGAAMDPAASGPVLAVLRGYGRLARGLAACLQPLWNIAIRLWQALCWWLPRTPALQALLLLALLAVQMPPALASPQTDTLAAGDQGPPASRRMALRELTPEHVLKLRSSDGHASVYFGSRADELITRARLRLRYTYSPALLPRDSHIKVLLNDEVIGVAAITHEQAGQSISEDFDIDPRFILDTNRLKFQLVGHYAATCEDPLRNSIWADVSGASELLLDYAPLALKNDLSLLPEPFFDRRDLRQLNLPFIMPASPALPTINAGAVVASWFGKLAGDRGARFPTHLDNLPAGHAVVIATNSARPAFLLGHPKVDGPTVEMITNPSDGHSKLLLVLGRDNNDLLMAAQSLVLGHAAMTGTRVSINSRNDTEARRPYDAPNWVRLDRPTKLGELIAYPQQLQATGHAPAPLRVDLRMPPDLYSWRGASIPFDLRYRYTPPVRAGESRLTASLNNELLQSLSLSPAVREGAPARTLADEALKADMRKLALPTFRLGGRNRLNFSFAFSRYQEGPCPDVPPDDSMRAQIDADSSLDFSGLHHFARMPNLNYFASVGYPFTKYADLSQTVIVMPDKPDIQEIETAITLLGYLGQSTGLPATRVRFVGPGEEATMQDVDLLVIGSALGQGVMTPWGELLPANLAGEVRRISQPARTSHFLYDWLGFGTVPDPKVLTQEKITASGPIALLLGFQSPFTPGRSVVAVTATAPDQLKMAVEALGNPEVLQQIHGSAVFMRPNRIDSFLVGDAYYVGELPWWITVWFPFSNHPVLQALVTILAALLLAFALWLWRRRQSREGETS